MELTAQDNQFDTWRRRWAWLAWSSQNKRKNEAELPKFINKNDDDDDDTYDEELEAKRPLY
jgi:hypothetical protein